MPNFIGQPTQIGEFLTGAFAGAVLALLLFNA
jgi:ABC-type enterobactin transport system permease subunit